MNTYAGLHAARYDLVFADKPYEREAQFVHERLGRLAPAAGAGPPRLLDLACGTGRHAVAFAALGWEVTGVDYNDELLDRARENAADAGADIRFLAQDMRALEVEGGPFQAVTCLFDSIGYPVTDEGVLAALRGARDQLDPAGALAVEFLHAPAVLRDHSPTRVRRWPTPEGGELLRIAETRLDGAARTLRVSYELLELEPEGAGYRRATEEQANRFFALEEMTALMEAAGLQVAETVPAYAPEGELDDRVWHVLALARRAEG